MVEDHKGVVDKNEDEVEPGRTSVTVFFPAEHPTPQMHSSSVSDQAMLQLDRDDCKEHPDQGGQEVLGHARQCSLCERYFDSPSKLQIHILSHTGHVPFCRSDSSRKSKQHSHLERHQQNHNGRASSESPGVLDCQSETPRLLPGFGLPGRPEGDACFLKEEQDHQNTHTLDPTCLTPSITPKHSKAKAHQCTVCLKNFNAPSKLSRHFLVHTGAKPFRCSICDRTFRQRCHLQSHRRTHSGSTHSGVQQSELAKTWDQGESSPPENLSLPEEWSSTAAFPLKESRDQILQSFGASPNRCLTVSHDLLNTAVNAESASAETPLCAKSEMTVCKTECQGEFPFSPDLESHNFIHTGETSQCDQALQQTMDLHVDQIHCSSSPSPSQTGAVGPESQKGGMYPFDQAGFSSDTALEYSMTMNEQEEDPGDWTAGSEVTVDPGVPVRRLCNSLSGLYCCEECRRCFDTEKKLRLHRCSHRRQERQKSVYQCAICPKTFEAPSKLKRHYVTHTGQRPFHCPTCGKTFTQSGHLKTHQLIHR
ncbi:zinc finger protein 770-like [Megalops cyprinoides]|uniref:zinc finger protein 770-like n=1 Tax=Megalops cyprinoides TaxID=118141 RepID=UPI0018644CA8|nr:zinc finger protein 770-like [Megalops cyprinoides]